MPIKKRGPAWQVTVCWHGQVHRRSSRHWTRDQAREVEKKLLNDLHAIDMGRKPERTFAEAVEKWLEDEAPKFRDIAREKAHLKAIAPFIDGRYLTEAPEIARTIKRASGTLSAATVNRRLAILRRLVNLAWKEWDWLDQPIGTKISLLADRGERHVYLTQDQVEQLARKCPRGGGYVLLAAYTGIRRGQLLRLTRADAAGDCLNLGADGKTGQPQLVPLHPRVRHLAKRLPLCSSDVLRGEWEAARAALKLGGVRWHDMRHSAASWLLQSGADLMHVRDLLGHQDVRTTQRYAHLRIANLRKALHKVGTGKWAARRN